MVTLLILVGTFLIECVGANCGVVPRVGMDAMVATGMAELIFELPGIVRIYRKNKKEE